MDKERLKHADKRIYKWDKVATGVILFGYAPDTLDVFSELYELAKTTFPDLKSSEVTCGRVQKSDRIKSFTLILFNVDFDKEVPAGWDFYNQPIDFSY